MARIRDDGDGGGFVVAGFGGHDVGNVGLRIAVVEGEPCALDFDEQGVALFEDVVYVVQAPVKLGDFAGLDGFWFVEAVAVAAAEDFHVGHELEAE